MTFTSSQTLEPLLGWKSPKAARLLPLRPGQLPLLSRIMMGVFRKQGKVDAPNLFLTLIRHRRLFGPWGRFVSRLMPYGTLDRVDCELAILRVAWNCRSKYEWFQHVAIGMGAGLSTTDIANVAEGPEATGWSEHHAAVLRAADEIHHGRIILDGTWAELARRYDDKKLIELCMLIGQYEMLASVLNSVGVQVEEPLHKLVVAAGIGAPRGDSHLLSTQ
jgi:alkylhydroperoxidase family enzyme